MERLTEKNDETYFYPHCFEEKCIGVSEPCSECEFEEKICTRLGEYEDTGITPDEIRELKDRDTAKAAEETQDACGDGRLICPNCRNSVINYFNRSRPPQFCMICGQRLRWEE